MGASIVALALALAFALALAPSARAQAVPPATAGSPAAADSFSLPADLGPERPIALPDPLRPDQADPEVGLQFGMGFPALRVTSDALGVALQGGTLTESGVLLHVEAVSGATRFGYARQIYLATLPDGTTLDGTAVDTLRFDSDQLWAWHGLRPLRSLYLGYGLGLQRRLTRVLNGSSEVHADPQTSLVAGLMVDWALGPPFSLQLRTTADLQAGFVQARTASLQLAFLAQY